MATCLEKIESAAPKPYENKGKHPWKNYHKKGKKWMKRQMNKYIRRQSIDTFIGKIGRKPTHGWEL